MRVIFRRVRDRSRSGSIRGFLSFFGRAPRQLLEIGDGGAFIRQTRSPTVSHTSDGRWMDGCTASCGLNNELLPNITSLGMMSCERTRAPEGPS